MNRTLSWTLLVLSLLLSACSSGPKIDECLVGIWQIDNADAYARAVLPEGAIPPVSLRFLRGSEEIAYKFDEDGVIQVLAVDWTADYEVDVEEDKVRFDMLIEGFVIGEYVITDNQRLMVTKVGTSQEVIQYQSSLDGEMMADTDRAVEFLPLFVTPTNIADVTCTEDTLSLTILNRADLESPLTFTRQGE